MPRPVPKDFFPPPFSGLQLFASAADDDEEDDDKFDNNDVHCKHNSSTFSQRGRPSPPLLTRSLRPRGRTEGVGPSGFTTGNLSCLYVV